MHRILASFAAILALACSSGREASDSSDTGEAEQGLRSGHASCVGYGWTSQIRDWVGVKGTYERRGGPVTGELSSLVVLDDPTSQNENSPNYEREIDGQNDSGKMVLGVDNPMIGPAVFFPESSIGAKDVYWVLGQKRNRKGELVGICLAQGSTLAGDNTAAPSAFMLVRTP